MPTKKSKAKKAPDRKAPAKKPQAEIIACPDDRPLRGARLLRSMFAAPGAKYSIDELVTAMGNKGKTPRASAAAVMCHLRNPDKTPDPLDIRRDKSSGKYSVVAAKKAPANGPRAAAG